MLLGKAMPVLSGKPDNGQGVLIKPESTIALHDELFHNHLFSSLAKLHELMNCYMNISSTGDGHGMAEQGYAQRGTGRDRGCPSHMMSNEEDSDPLVLPQAYNVIPTILGTLPIVL